MSDYFSLNFLYKNQFIVKNSVEERMLELQDKKRKLMASAFSSKMSAEEKRQARINDIQTLMDLSGAAARPAAGQ